jgi:hypothetical protein
MIASYATPAATMITLNALIAASKSLINAINTEFRALIIA